MHVILDIRIPRYILKNWRQKPYPYSEFLLYCLPMPRNQNALYLAGFFYPLQCDYFVINQKKKQKKTAIESVLANLQWDRQVLLPSRRLSYYTRPRLRRECKGHRRAARDNIYSYLSYRSVKPPGRWRAEMYIYVVSLPGLWRFGYAAMSEPEKDNGPSPPSSENTAQT
jgi:hypothetical protein